MNLNGRLYKSNNLGHFAGNCRIMNLLWPLKLTILSELFQQILKHSNVLTWILNLLNVLPTITFTDFNLNIAKELFMFNTKIYSNILITN